MLPSHKQQVIGLIEDACAQVGATGVAVALERPKIEAHGDVATNVALQVAKAQKRNPREVAGEIASTMRASGEFSSLIESIEVAGPGFINLRLTAAVKQQVVLAVLSGADKFGTTHAHAGQRVMVEFVSANPTGPLHLGHARQAALGDVLANLLAAQGWQVTREFYYNDAGAQIANLAISVQARAKELLGEAASFPEDGYRGEYIAEIARDYLARATIERDGAAIVASGDVNDLGAIERFAVAYLRGEQDRDLAALGVSFDSFFLESSLYDDRKVEAAVNAMTASGMTYEHEGALWLKTTAIDIHGHGGPPADDKDRVMRKSDGSYTYFVPDVAYHITKLQRGYDKVINIQGTDHYGTVARVRAGLQAAAKSLGMKVPHGYPDYMLHKMLRVTMGGEEVKMSKRAGTYVTLRDLLDWVGRDAARFFLVSRKPDAEFVFDVDLAVSQSDENPVYYVQYAHARICSVFAQALEKGFAVPDAASAQKVSLAALKSAREQSLMNRLADYPDAIANATDELAPHHVAAYLKEVAADFHAYYNAERVLVDDDDTRNARLALLLATRQVLSNGLGLLGVSAPERM